MDMYKGEEASNFEEGGGEYSLWNDMASSVSKLLNESIEEPGELRSVDNGGGLAQNGMRYQHDTIPFPSMPIMDDSLPLTNSDNDSPTANASPMFEFNGFGGGDQFLGTSAPSPVRAAANQASMAQQSRIASTWSLPNPIGSGMNMGYLPQANYQPVFTAADQQRAAASMASQRAAYLQMLLANGGAMYPTNGYAATPYSSVGLSQLMPSDIESLARMVGSSSDAVCTWSGTLPIKDPKIADTYSCKVFLGGVPFDITEDKLIEEFKKFGPVQVEWPGKEQRQSHWGNNNSSQKNKGYAYIVFESPKSVKALLEQCIPTVTPSAALYMDLPTVTSRGIENRRVQVIPWNIADSTHLRSPSQHYDQKKAVFVGALHGLITADVLSDVFDDLFGGVVFAALDVDKFKYPIGSGRVIFNNEQSFRKALKARFVEIKCSKFSKKVQIDPFLEQEKCKFCKFPGVNFCREQMCFSYFCDGCWLAQHSLLAMKDHVRMTKNHTRRCNQSSDASSSYNGPRA